MARTYRTSDTRVHGSALPGYLLAQVKIDSTRNGNGIGAGQPSLHLHMLGVPRRVAGSWW